MNSCHEVLWVNLSWISKLSIVVFLIEIVSNRSGNFNELIHEILVSDVCVKVILEMFKHVHVFVHKFISPNSWV